MGIEGWEYESTSTGTRETVIACDGCAENWCISPDESVDEGYRAHLSDDDDDEPTTWACSPRYDLEPGETCRVCEEGSYRTVWTGHDWLSTSTPAHLYAADTAELIEIATPAQVEASALAGETGIILVDADGEPIAESSWDAQQPGVRKVYAA